MFNLERLRALHALSTHGSIAAAAASLHVTPSGMSQQLTKLEKEAGQELFVRQGRTVQLTAPGRLLALHAREILDRVLSAQAELETFHDAVVGTVRIGALPTLIDGVLPKAAKMLSRRFPSLQITCVDGESNETIPRVVQRELDIAIFDSWEYSPTALPSSVSQSEITGDIADLALPSYHPLATRQALNLSEVEDVNWITWSENSTFSEWMIRTLHNAGLDPTVNYAVGNFQTQLSLVATGLGAALIPRLERPPIPEAVSIVPVHPALRRSISALWLTDSERASVRAVVKAIRTVANDVTL